MTRHAWMSVLLWTAAICSAEPVWIDVRSPEEYAAGHLAGAVNLPYLEIGTRITEVARDPDTDIRLYCAVGGRAQMAKVWLQSLGYTKVTNEGGLEDATRKLAASAQAVE